MGSVRTEIRHFGKTDFPTYFLMVTFQGCFVNKFCIIQCLEQLKALGSDFISQELNFKIDEVIFVVFSHL